MKTYKTRDIYLAAVLIVLGAKLDRTDKADPRHQEFHFSANVENSPVDEILHGIDFEKVETDYANAELMINAVKFKEALQRMKSIIHSN